MHLRNFWSQIPRDSTRGPVRRHARDLCTTEAGRRRRHCRNSAMVSSGTIRTILFRQPESSTSAASLSTSHRRLPNHLSSAGRSGHELGTHRREAAPPAARRRCSEDRVRDIRPIALHANEAAPPQARAPRPEQTPKRRGVSSPTDCSPWPCQSFVLASDERPSRQSGLCARLGARGRCPAAHRPTSNAYDSPLGSGTSNALRVNETNV